MNHGTARARHKPSAQLSLALRLGRFRYRRTSRLARNRAAYWFNQMRRAVGTDAKP